MTKLQKYKEIWSDFRASGYDIHIFKKRRKSRAKRNKAIAEIIINSTVKHTSDFDEYVKNEDDGEGISKFLLNLCQEIDAMRLRINLIAYQPLPGKYLKKKFTGGPIK